VSINWNLPPGCSPRDIPGNRPEDEAWERAMEEAQERADRGDFADDRINAMLDMEQTGGLFDEDKWLEGRIYKEAERILEAAADDGYSGPDTLEEEMY